MKPEYSDLHVCNITLTTMATQAVTPFNDQESTSWPKTQAQTPRPKPRRAFRQRGSLLFISLFSGLVDCLIK
jgi:hypothetical protein